MAGIPVPAYFCEAIPICPVLKIGIILCRQDSILVILVTTIPATLEPRANKIAGMAMQMHKSRLRKKLRPTQRSKSRPLKRTNPTTQRQHVPASLHPLRYAAAPKKPALILLEYPAQVRAAASCARTSITMLETAARPAWPPLPRSD